MFGLGAVLCFALAFILKLLSVSTGAFDLVVLGLVLLALHLTYPWRPVSPP